MSVREKERQRDDKWVLISMKTDYVGYFALM